MCPLSSLIENDMTEYLKCHDKKSLLRFITCGSVDDGKSTLIGRLLYESRVVFEDQLSDLERDSKKWGTQGGAIDFALLVDGLVAEREQGITIDVAYRFFSTEKRKFIVADTPGHEQYTCNMATGASTAELAILLIDARKGILPQTCRHAFICSLLGIRKFVLAVNKMDMVAFDEKVFQEIVACFSSFTQHADIAIDMTSVQAIPLCAVAGDNVLIASERMPWYHGLSLMVHLETVSLSDDYQGNSSENFRMPVQWVNRPHLDFRGYTGRIIGGTINVGDGVRILPKASVSKVSHIVVMRQDGTREDLTQASDGQSVTLVLEDNIDISRGDVISSYDHSVEVSDQFNVTLIWMSDVPMLPGRSYVLKIGTKIVNATVSGLKYKKCINTMENLAATTLELNDIGVCTLSLDQNVAFDTYANNRQMGSFILIDRISNDTIGAGMVNHHLRRADNIHMQLVDIDKAAHALQKSQKPVIIWFTGFSGSGKSTIANELQKLLYDHGKHSFLLDGDNIRHGLNRDLGFTDADRVENIRRVAEVSRLMLEAGLITLVSFISPFRAERQLARSLVEEGEFVEVFIDTPFDVVEARDPKGLYKKARSGALDNFTGIDSPYEVPVNPEILIDTTKMTAQEAAQEIYASLYVQK